MDAQGQEGAPPSVQQPPGPERRARGERGEAVRQWSPRECLHVPWLQVRALLGRVGLNCVYTAGCVDFAALCVHFNLITDDVADTRPPTRVRTYLTRAVSGRS